METASKRPRGRPRKNAPIPTGLEEETPSAVPLAPEELDSADAAELERDLQRAMDAVDDVQVFAVDRIVDDEFSHTPTSTECRTATNEPKPQGSNAVRVKKMTSTTRKMMKFGYSQVLRAADTVTKGKVPGEKMAYILRNDEAADAILDEILNELDQKYKVEQYLGPESKLALFTAQLFIQARESDLSE